MPSRRVLTLAARATASATPTATATAAPPTESHSPAPPRSVRHDVRGAWDDGCPYVASPTKPRIRAHNGGDDDALLLCRS
jgi:hypothetical protein